MLLLVFLALGLIVPPLGGLFWWKWSSGRWWMHLLFAPVLVGFEYALVSGLLYGSGDTGDTPGLGLAMLPPFAVFVFTASIYYIALVIKVVNRFLKVSESDLS